VKPSPKYQKPSQVCCGCGHESDIPHIFHDATSSPMSVNLHESAGLLDPEDGAMECKCVAATEPSKGRSWKVLISMEFCGCPSKNLSEPWFRCPNKSNLVMM